MKICFMFSGQGSQYDGMGKELYENFEICKEIFDKSSEILNLDMTEICFGGSDKLNQTEFTQPAILTLGYAIFKLMEENNIKADYMAGLSLGEYTALCAGGVLNFEEAVSLVRKRGKFMTEAVPAGEGAMTAVMNVEESIIQDVLNQASIRTQDLTEVVTIANYNTASQMVIAGHTKAVERAEAIFKEKGLKKFMRLKVSGPFHTELLKPASDKLKLELENISINNISMPIYTNLTGCEIKNSPQDIKDTLVKQVMSPVKWEQTIKNLVSEGVDTFIELGCGKTLTMFAKKISPDVEVYSVENIASLEAVLNKIKN